MGILLEITNYQRALGMQDLGADFIAQFIGSEALYVEYYEKIILAQSTKEFWRVMQKELNRYAINTS